jgi:arylsulfatase A-like enzyme
MTLVAVSPSCIKTIWLNGGLALSLALIGSNRACADEKSPPNVVIILADDLGMGALGYQGNTFHETPNLDRLAAESMRFEQAYAAAPICTPSRAALMIGKQPGRFHLTRAIAHNPNEAPTSGGPARPAIHPSLEMSVPENSNHLPLPEITFAELLRASGYYTGFTGKWHLGGAGFGPDKQGFDWVGTQTAYGSVQSFYPPYGNYDINDQRPGEFMADRLTREAVGFLEDAKNKNQPFCLEVAYFLPHVPFQAPNDLVAKYQEKALKTSHDSKWPIPIYAAMIEKLDQCAGVILDKLEALGLAENTVVIFTSDNGGEAYASGTANRLNDHGGLRGGKGMPYEGGVRIPLLMRVPGVTSCSTDYQVSLMDILPTLAELAGRTDLIPNGIDGRSLAPLFRGETPPQHDWMVFWPHQLDGLIYAPAAQEGCWAAEPSATLRQGDFKLVRYFDKKSSELYNLKDDRGEKRNVASRYPERVQAMEQDLVKSLDGYDLPRANQQYNPRWGVLQHFGLVRWLPFDSTLKILDGNMSLECQAPDPFLKCVNPQPGATGPYSVVFRARGSVQGGLEGYYSDEADPQKQKLAAVDGKLSSDWSESVMHIPTTEMLHDFRIDWGVTAGTVEVDWVRLENAAGVQLRKWDMIE